MRKKTILASSVLMSCALGSVGVAYAATNSGVSHGHDSGTVISGKFGSGMLYGTGPASLTIGGPGGALTIDLLADAAQALNLSTSTLQSDLAKGTSLATIAAQNASSVSTLEAAMVKEATVQIQNAVTKGTLTATQASKLETNLSTVIDAFVTGAPLAGPMQPQNAN